MRDLLWAKSKSSDRVLVDNLINEKRYSKNCLKHVHLNIYNLFRFIDR